MAFVLTSVRQGPGEFDGRMSNPVCGEKRIILLVCATLQVKFWGVRAVFGAVHV